MAWTWKPLGSRRGLLNAHHLIFSLVAIMPESRSIVDHPELLL